MHDKRRITRDGLRLFAGDVVVNDLLMRSGETYALQISGACAARRVWACLSQGTGGPLAFRRGCIRGCGAKCDGQAE
jgi:hypothetical protein